MNFRIFAVLTMVILAGCRGPQTIPDQVQHERPEPQAPEAVPEKAKPSTEKGERKSEKVEVAEKEVARPRLIELNQKYFVVQYDPEYKLAKYVRYTMTAEQLRIHSAKRRDKFHPDPQLPVKLQVTPKEYSRSGYDRGHLAPAADFSYSQEANDATFVMSNMAPQTGNLNRNSWKDLEEQVRRWACGEEKVTVITGPIFAPEMAHLKSGLVIPPQFFKIVIDETPPRKVLAFIYNQSDRGKLVPQRMVPLQEVLDKIHEKFSADFQEPIRQPSQLNTWKEKNC